MKAKTDSKSQLINTAYRLFLTKSYNSTSTSLICEEASINKGTFYHFFHSKADLLIACIRLHSENITTNIEAINNTDLSGREKLGEFLLLSVKSIRETFEETGQVSGCLLGNITLELSTIDNNVRNEIIKETQKIQNKIIPILDFYAQENNLDMDTKKASEILFAYLQGNILLAKLHNDPSRVSEILPTSAQLLKSISTPSYAPELVD